MSEESVYWVLGCIKAIAGVAQEKFDELVKTQVALFKEEDELDLSGVLRIIRGATIEGDDLLKKGKLR